MPDEPTGPRSSRPADAELESVPSTSRRRISALRIPEDAVSRPLTPPILARAESLDDVPASDRGGLAASFRVKTSPDAFEMTPAAGRAAPSDLSLEDILVDAAPNSARTRQPTLVDPFEAGPPPDDVPAVAVRPLAMPPMDAPSVLDLDDVGGELDDVGGDFDDTPTQPAATLSMPTPGAIPVGLAPPPGAHGPGSHASAKTPVRTPPATGNANSRGRSRLGVDSMPPQARPWWEALFQDDYLRFSPPRTAQQVAADVRFIEQRLNLASGARVLDLACGDGAHAALLAARGFEVVGIDTSLPLLARASAHAQSANQRVQFQQLDMRDLAENAAYDGAIIWDNGFGFFDDAANESVLTKVHRALRPRGQILIDLLNRDYAVPRLPSLVWFQGDRCICMDDAHVDEATSRLVVHRTVLFEEGRSREYDYSLRLFSSHELRAMLERAGFRVVEVSGHVATPGAFFGGDAPRLIMLAERPLVD